MRFAAFDEWMQNLKFRSQTNVEWWNQLQSSNFQTVNMKELLVKCTIQFNARMSL